MPNEQIRETIFHALKQFRVLTQEQICIYVEKATGLNRLDVIDEIKRMKTARDIYSDDYNVSLLPIKGEQSRKEIIAFWTLIAFIDHIGMDYAKAPWPSTIIFFDQRLEKVARITVCDNPHHDPDMIALLDTHDEYHQEIISGCDFDVEDINPDMLPADDFIYAKICGSPMLSVPNVLLKKVKRAKDVTSKEE